ncbi:leucine-rich repeat domain-containing protein [Chaetoceros tenuissimus]|uniref:Leucine-rich repeat domain-containing protein n=1 Tax=Chaetoceros tenuissimus TaxID=426638 RepID=A0AAD3D4Y0_9STRA|nr:leucine-rich repeat domain-containing protein [Chaetoceros tenuissimus]
MRVQTEEWRRFIPGVRMYKGKKTYFYNGETLWEGEPQWDGHVLIYDKEERRSWQVIIILPGVEVIPAYTFHDCQKIETVIMADNVKRIEEGAFKECASLSHVRFSINLEYIGDSAFYDCKSLTSIFVPPSCTEIDNWAFDTCSKLIIFVVPQHTQLGEWVIADTALIRRHLFRGHMYDGGLYDNANETIDLIKNINGDTEEYALHRACSSYNPIIEIIHGIVKRQGFRALKKHNELGITPLQYLDKNPFTDITQSALMKRFVLDMIGEVV